MNIQESMEFVNNNRPICCGKQVDNLCYNRTNSYQYFVCRCCDKRIEINYWPLSLETIRELKLDILLNYE